MRTNILHNLILAFGFLGQALYGQEFPASMNVSDLDGTNGFAIRGGWFIGSSVAGGEDINGDGVDDVSFHQGWTLFGRTDAFPSLIDLDNIDSTSGFQVSPISGLGLGTAVVKDINGDQLADLLIAGYPFDFGFGRAHGWLIFGDTVFSTIVDLDFDGSNGFEIEGELTDPQLGWESIVDGGGDINGDGFNDLLFKDNTGGLGASQGIYDFTYVIFGTDQSFGAQLLLADLNGPQGFKIQSLVEVDSDMSAAGDINNDGFDDILIGMPVDSGGCAYVVFGNTQFGSTPIDVDNMDSTDGFKVVAADVRTDPVGDRLGLDVSDAGDINNDGIEDFALSAHRIRLVYFIFGTESGFPKTLNVADLDGSNGFTFDASGLPNAVEDISGLGDVNGDGIDDFIIGSTVLVGGIHPPGAAAIIFGRDGNFDAVLTASSLDGSNGFVFNGAQENDQTGASVSSAGDINHDGVGDMLVGAPGISQVYVVYGRDLHALDFSTPPEASDIGASKFTLSLTWEETGTAYYAVLPEGSSAPTADDIVNGVVGVASGSFEIDQAGVVTSTEISGLLSVTTYEVFVAAQDQFGNTTGIEQLTVTTSVITSLEDSEENSINAYPNPVGDRLHIEVRQETPSSGVWEIDLLDVLGKSYLSATLKARDGHYSLDVTKLPSGFYLLTLTNGQEALVNRIFKQ